MPVYACTVQMTWQCKEPQHQQMVTLFLQHNLCLTQKGWYIAGLKMKIFLPGVQYLVLWPVVFFWLWIGQGAHFSDDYFALNPYLTENTHCCNSINVHQIATNFEHACHEQNFVMITTSECRWEKKEIPSNLNSDGKTVSFHPTFPSPLSVTSMSPSISHKCSSLPRPTPHQRSQQHYWTVWSSSHCRATFLRRSYTSRLGISSPNSCRNMGCHHGNYRSLKIQSTYWVSGLWWE